MLQFQIWVQKAYQYDLFFLNIFTLQNLDEEKKDIDEDESSPVEHLCDFNSENERIGSVIDDMTCEVQKLMPQHSDQMKKLAEDVKQQSNKQLKEMEKSWQRIHELQEEKVGL